MRFLSVKANAFLIEFTCLQETMAAYRTLQHAQHPYIRELVPAARTILVYFDPLFISIKTLIKWIDAQKIFEGVALNGKELVIPVRYNGEDIEHVADLVGLSVSELIYKHSQTLWRAAFIGFAPGFAYLVSDEPPFGSIPRLASPRKKIISGSVGLAGEYSGVYPKDSPGGWQLIGKTDLKMWDVQREQPALLLPNDHVIFKDVTHQPTQISVPNISSLPKKQSTESEAVLRVKKVGLQVLIQDVGRLNMAKMGVGRAGAMDQTSFQSANLAVGNPQNAAALEILNGGLVLSILKPTVIAVTGADAELSVQYAQEEKVRAPLYQPIALDQGDEVYLAVPNAGVRNYLAVWGGLAVENILGSASYDSLAELGALPLKIGDKLASAQLKTHSVDLSQSSFAMPKQSDVIVIDLHLGPRTDWFKTSGLELLFQQKWLVTTESNRVGLRLHGKHALQRKIEHELPSEGCSIGALQIPPNGQPVLFMRDHPITGGYPVIATVAAYHLDLVAQIPSGSFIQFRKITEFMDIQDHEK
ncbi:MAG: 5-oxoprolinase/urea amidolyase family protein [Acinetobacter venetianus]|uniref:5-oxoprolinase subunit B/C family protein n=1 Tax=Acinetobacter venetianus TaxID=52133 RepID=UPI003C71040F